MGIHYSLIPQFDKRNLYKHLNIRSTEPFPQKVIIKNKKEKLQSSCNTPLNIRLPNYNSLVRPRIEYGIVTWGGV